jgi:hypothetical protein
MQDRSPSPRLAARAAGLLYLIVILGGGFAEAYVRQKLIVSGNPAATAANILAHEQLYRWAFVADLIPLLCNVLLAVIFYFLFRIVSKSLAGLVVFFSLIGTAIQASVLLYHLAALMVLKGPVASSLGMAHSEALAYFMLRLQSFGYNIALVFFGCFGLCMGALILKSGFLPRVLGILMAIAGFCYFTNSMLSFVAPSLSSVLLLMPCLIGEGGFMLWLLAFGVNAERWSSRHACYAPA